MTGVASLHRESGRSKRRKIIRGEKCTRKAKPIKNAAAHTHPQIKRNKNAAAGCGCVCGAAGVCPPWTQRKQNKREEMCAPPHRPSSHAHTSRLPQCAVRRRPSSCVQQARRTGPSS
ncbi:hypothetical protein TCDM_11814 [Trypanosoma cruzi Dm28c]|uniref:Uncharacterized protein n=1 Tax=Trypanosoma cruzi Dm28c TaxID=1416333 RepID=V5CZK8_TRYCR|nr:hypothetical protein TCDM_11814 [Trypanosoma cruzi Dm28c]